MRTPWMWGAALAVLLCSENVAAQTFGQLGPAPPLAPNARLFGAYLTAGSDALGMVAQLRLSFMPGVDFGFQGGLNRVDVAGGDHTTVRMGADVKFAVTEAQASMPLDLAAGGSIGVQTGDRFTVLSLGPNLVASHRFPLGGEGTVSPYVGLLLRFSTLDVAGTSDTDFDPALRLGADLRIDPDLGFIGEVQFNDDSGDDVGFLTGLNISF